MESIKSSKTWDIVFFVLLIGISILYSYQDILFLRPTSIHQWRQCDCLSLTLNYYKEGMHFFSPSVHLCGPTGNGMTTTSECPLIYYFVAILWQIFGYHEIIYRILDLVIAFSGLYALFRLTKELLDDGAWALLVSLFLFSSPIYVFYANNFLTDVPALSFAIIGWYFFVKYYKTKRLLFNYFSLLFFLLAGLSKISALISFVPLVVFFIWEMLNKNKSEEEKIFIKPAKQGIVLFVALILIVAWTSYSIYYNNLHNEGLFSTGIFPVWKMDKGAIKEVASKFYVNLTTEFYNKKMLFFILALFAFMVFNFRKMSRFYLWLIILVFGGVIAYTALWFKVLDEHDYYLTNLLIFIPVVLVSFLVFLKNRYTKLFNSIFTKIIFALLLGWNIYYCAVRVNLRYYPQNPIVTHSFIAKQPEIDYWVGFKTDYEKHVKAFETITPYLRQLGISRDDKVISLPDHSIDISLYLMDQKGFTGFEIEDGYGFNSSDKEATMKKIIGLGAKYLIVSDDSYLNLPWLKPYLTHTIGSYQNVKIFNLKNI